MYVCVGMCGCVCINKNPKSSTLVRNTKQV